MSTLQAALQNVGYKPTIRPRDVQRRKERQTTTAIIEAILADAAAQPVCISSFSEAPMRKIIYQNAGGFIRARFDGMRNSCFGTTSSDAGGRLKMWGAEPGTSSRGKKLLDAKFDREPTTTQEKTQ
jgi:hypothetical protein